MPETTNGPCQGCDHYSAGTGMCYNRRGEYNLVDAPEMERNGCFKLHRPIYAESKRDRRKKEASSAAD